MGTGTALLEPAEQSVQQVGAKTAAVQQLSVVNPSEQHMQHVAVLTAADHQLLVMQHLPCKVIGAGIARMAACTDCVLGQSVWSALLQLT